MTATGDSVRIVKTVRAPIELVYRAFIDPDELVRWMHPDQFTGVSAANDPRVGGRGELIHAMDGLEVGGFDEEADQDHRSRMTIELRETDPGSTEVTLTHDRLGEAPPGGHMGVNTGWTQALESLQRHFQQEGEEP